MHNLSHPVCEVSVDTHTHTHTHTLGCTLTGMHNLSYPVCVLKQIHKHKAIHQDICVSLCPHSPCQCPLFLSVFWSSPTSTDTLSLPVRQLLDSVAVSLYSYTGTDSEVLYCTVHQPPIFLYTTVLTKYVTRPHSGYQLLCII